MCVECSGHGVQELQRLLFVFSKLNPGLDYVQGMNELAAPLYMVFKGNAASDSDAANAEADTFFCFVSLMTLSEMRDLYTKSLDASNTGVKAVLRECVPCGMHEHKTGCATAFGDSCRV